MVPRGLRDWVLELVWETKHALVVDIRVVLDALMLASTVGRAANTCNKASKDARSAQKPTQLLTLVQQKAPSTAERHHGGSERRVMVVTGNQWSRRRNQ